MSDTEKFICGLSLADMELAAPVFGVECDTSQWLDYDYPDNIDELSVNLLNAIDTLTAKAALVDELVGALRLMVVQFGCEDRKNPYIDMAIGSADAVLEKVEENEND